MSKVAMRCVNVNGYAVFTFFVIQFASLKTKNEHYIRFSIGHEKNEKRLQTNYPRFPNSKLATRMIGTRQVG